MHLRLALLFCACSLLSGFASAETYLAIDYFPLIYPNETTPVNSIVRVSEAAIVCKNDQGAVEKCNAEWVNYTDNTCSDWFLNTNSNDWYIAKIAIENEFVVVTHNYEGGNGGARTYWKLFYIHQFNKLNYSCPSPIYQPEMSGVEISEGGNVWYELNCEKGEDFTNCAERNFYPKSGATRLEFSSSGKNFKNVPSKPKIPE